MKETLPEFVDHLVFRVRDLQMTERFYTQLLGLSPRRVPDSLMWQVGDTRLFFTKAVAGDSRYDKEQVGLNHLAFGVRSVDELRTMVKRLDKGKIPHSGVKIDHYGNKEFVWLDDPCGIRIEFYVRPAE
jgi:catechol-2,3-dioxygenase